MQDKYYKLFSRIKKRIFGKFPRLSYARSGEDLILEEILGMYKQSGFYIDVGAYHPVHYSNTYKFYLKGWTGLNVDANIEVIQEFKNKRPRDINVNIAVSEVKHDTNYYMFNEDSSMNTSSTEFLQTATRKGLTVKQIRVVKATTLEDLLDRYLPTGQEIDFLSVDVEGLDLQVLKSNNWNKYRPKVIVVETSDALADLSSSELVQFLRSNNYKQVAYSLVTIHAGNVYFIDTRK